MWRKSCHSLNYERVYHCYSEITFLFLRALQYYLLIINLGYFSVPITPKNIFSLHIFGDPEWTFFLWINNSHRFVKDLIFLASWLRKFFPCLHIAISSADAQTAHDARSLAEVTFIPNFIPAFNARDPALWLTQAKVVFRIRNIRMSARIYSSIHGNGWPVQRYTTLVPRAKNPVTSNKGLLTFCQQRRLALEKCRVAEEEFKNLVWLRFIRRFSSD